MSSSSGRGRLDLKRVPTAGLVAALVAESAAAARCATRRWEMTPLLLLPPPTTRLLLVRAAMRDADWRMALMVDDVSIVDKIMFVGGMNGK